MVSWDSTIVLKSRSQIDHLSIRYAGLDDFSLLRSEAGAKSFVSSVHTTIDGMNSGDAHSNAVQALYKRWMLDRNMADIPSSDLVGPDLRKFCIAYKAQAEMYQDLDLDVLADAFLNDGYAIDSATHSHLTALRASLKKKGGTQAARTRSFVQYSGITEYLANHWLTRHGEIDG